jgi:POT family proton-dependent oligopeptide transporter
MSLNGHHPKALPFLFLTEMWERFGFYVVQGMLVLYMTKSFGFSDDKSFTIAGLFAALAYISPLIGGFIADRVLGFKVAIVWGGVFLILGYAILALPFHHFFYLGLATIIVGNGLFKPNISSLLGALYEPGDSGRDTGFTIFYMGINIGVLLAGVGSGYVKDHFGWHASFALASIGLFIGLCTFGIGVKTVGMHYPFKPTFSKKKWLAKRWLVLYCLAAIAGVCGLLQSTLLGKWFLPIVGVFLLIFVFSLAARQEPEFRKKLFTLNILIISSIIFWAIFLQMFLSTNLFIDRLIDRQIMGTSIPTTVFYALESVFVILFGPLFAWGWSALNQSNKNPSPVMKFVFAIIFAGCGCLVLAMSTHFVGANNLISPLWIVFAYLLITIGELLLSPIGLAAVTMLSPTHLTGLMMGVWFTALGFGGQFAGALAKMSSIPDTAQNPIAELPIYHHAYMDYAYLSFGVAIILFIVHLFFRKNLQR